MTSSVSLSLSLSLSLLRDERDPLLRRMMRDHYSAPNGFVARRIIYRVEYDGHCFGFTTAGSATRFLPGRAAFFGHRRILLNTHVNNTFFHVEKPYSIRNFVQRVVKLWRQRVARDWFAKYGNAVWGFETLVEPPRTGECYLRDGWSVVGLTKGYTCKRVAGESSDSWTGKRVWNTTDLRPKLVLVRSVI